MQADVARIVEIYRRSGRFDIRVEPKIIELPNNRVDLVFEITEGAKTGVKNIEFVGNRAYSGLPAQGRDQDRARPESAGFLKTTDIYDPDRIEADRELLRRFYLKHGFADVRIVSRGRRIRSGPAGASSSPSRSRRASSTASGRSTCSRTCAPLDPALLRPRLRASPGDVYNAEAVEKTVEDMTDRSRASAATRSRRCARAATAISRRGRSISSSSVEEGARAYIERINIRGNTRTRDYVIRREFDIAEGDAYNRALIDRAERRLKNLSYFKTVKITNEPGSAPDRVVINVDVEEQSTGEFSVSGGYSTADGFLAEVSVAERNLLGRGQYAKASVQYGQYARGFELSFVEPYFLGYRVALGLDLFAKEQQLDATTSPTRPRRSAAATRLGFALREDLGLQLRYSLFQQKITLPDNLKNCNNINPDCANGTFPTPDRRCLSTRRPAPPFLQQLLRRRRGVAGGQERAGARRGPHLAGRLHAVAQHARQQQEPDQGHA